MNIFIATFLFMLAPSHSEALISVNDIAGKYEALIQAEDQGNLTAVMRHRRDLLKACEGKDLSVLISGDENALLRLGCSRVIGQDHQLNGRHSTAVEALNPIYKNYLDTKGPEKQVAIKTMLPLAQSPDSILLICNQFGTSTQFDLHTFFKPDISPSYHQIRLQKYKLQSGSVFCSLIIRDLEMLFRFKTDR